jgi:hypothetical protein
VDEITKQILSYGLLGVAVVVEGLIIRYLHKRADDRETWWQSRYDTLMERHMITSEKWASKGLETGEALQLLATNLRPVSARRDRGGGG